MQKGFVFVIITRSCMTHILDDRIMAALLHLLSNALQGNNKQCISTLHIIIIKWGCPNGTKYPPRQPIPNRAIYLTARVYRQTDGQGDSSIPPPNFVAGGIKKTCSREANPKQYTWMGNNSHR